MTADRALPTSETYEPAAYWSERLAGNVDIEAVGWRGLGSAYNHWLYRRRARVFDQVGRHYGFARRPPSVLELGPGSGFYVERWARLGVRDLTGIDIALPAVAHLRERFPTYQFLTGDIGRPFALPPRAFDMVTAFDVLFHVADAAAWEQALATMRQALRPGGLALITDLFPATRAIALPHQVSRTEGAYRAVLARHGLRLERRWPVFVLMHPWAEPRSGVARRLAPAWWALVQRAAGHLPGAGTALGAVLFAVDAALSRIVRDGGPSTELWAIRRAED